MEVGTGLLVNVGDAAMKPRPEVKICITHSTAQLKPDGDWSWSNFKEVMTHRFDVIMKESRECPRCKVTEERDGSRPVTYDGKTWAR